jgi:hypothetical protein
MTEDINNIFWFLIHVQLPMTKSLWVHTRKLPDFLSLPFSPFFTVLTPGVTVASFVCSDSVIFRRQSSDDKLSHSDLILFLILYHMLT